MIKASALKRARGEKQIRELVEREYDRYGGIFRLAPAWVGRPGIIIPGRRIKLADDYISQDVAVNERWLASVTYADNGVYNGICPEDHGLSYIVAGEYKIQLKDAIEVCGELLLGRGKKWDVLPKFFDNWDRIPHHMHPCQDHCGEGLTGKPESYHFPAELNMDSNAYPSTPIGVDPYYTDSQIMNYLRQYFKGYNRLTDLANTVNLIPGTGWFMPPCTLHAPGSLVTYELQVASDVTCIPESRVNDMVMPPDLVDRDIPVKVSIDGFEKVCEYMLSMIRCRNAGNSENFRKEYFRPPVTIFNSVDAVGYFVIYRTGKASEAENADLYSAKKTIVRSGAAANIRENAAFGAIVLGGHGKITAADGIAFNIESVSMYPSRDDIGGDEFFVAAGAASGLTVECGSMEDLSLYQHFASGSNPEAASLNIPEYITFGNGLAAIQKV